MKNKKELIALINAMYECSRECEKVFSEEGNEKRASYYKGAAIELFMVRQLLEDKKFYEDMIKTYGIERG